MKERESRSMQKERMTRARLDLATFCVHEIMPFKGVSVRQM